MSIVAYKDVEKLVCRLTCGEGESCSKATAFLISNNRVITATHAIKNFHMSNHDIVLEFLNLGGTPITRKAIPLDLDPSPITILELEENIENAYYINFCDYKVEKDDMYEIFGYPVAKWGVGDWIKSNVTRRITNEMAQPYDWDIDLNHNSNIEDFEGLSGSPLFVNTKLVGVILTETLANGKAIALGSISVQIINDILVKAGINIEQSLDYDMYEVYELEEGIDYSDCLFVAKLESANIFDHEDCQQEFFNAEIAKSSIESMDTLIEIKKFTMMKNNIRGVWKTLHRPYKNESDGNELLSLVYQRVEDLSETTLKGDGNLSLMVKKGILHQLSDECKVGWVKDYSKRVKDYLIEKEKNI
ncbi:hypothetical protein P4601_16135 [Peribacillus frigoritolerans]|uniref:hypothetical protein n=1 Tax=Peribacillus frigoritolerans TaxID=450367 RepID=UPI002E236E81|nr:hypothetical protein [Peribacillus frigoritolerans]